MNFSQIILNPLAPINTHFNASDAKFHTEIFAVAKIPAVEAAAGGVRVPCERASASITAGEAEYLVRRPCAP